MRRLTAEQDNIHAALRWAVDRRDAGMALRFGQALGWFWLLRGQRRESGTMAREILAISEHADRDLGVVNARAVCALTVLTAFWDIAEVSQALADAGPLMRPEPGADGGGVLGDRPPHPLVVVGAAMLALWEKRDPDQALRVSSAHFESPDPWTRSSLDAPQARETARQTLGGLAFDHAYLRGRELGYDEALALAEGTVRYLAEKVTAGRPSAS